jgi:hypothetical protein
LRPRVRDARFEPDALPRGLRRDRADAAVDQALQLRVVQFERQCAGVDPGELEQVVHERGERLNLLADRGQVLVRLREPVLDRLEHRAQRADRRTQVVARPRDELTPGVEEPLELVRHGVERAGELGQLTWAALVGPHGEVARGDGARGVAQTPDPGRGRGRQEERSADCDRRGRRRDGEDLHVVAHVEHDPAGEEDARERERHREQGEAGQLRPDAREQTEREREDAPDEERGERDDDGEADHGLNR